MTSLSVHASIFTFRRKCPVGAMKSGDILDQRCGLCRWERAFTVHVCNFLNSLVMLICTQDTNTVHFTSFVEGWLKCVKFAICVCMRVWPPNFGFLHDAENKSGSECSVQVRANRGQCFIRKRSDSGQTTQQIHTEQEEKEKQKSALLGGCSLYFCSVSW